MSGSKILAKYQNKWVALTPDRERVVDFAESLKVLANRIKKLGDKDVIITFVMPMDRYYSPLCHL